MTIPDDTLREALSKVTGDREILAADVRWDLRNPCADCPFMKTSQFHQGVAKSIPSLLEAIDSHSFAHTCHKTDNRKACDGPIAGKHTDKPVQHCVGSILMLLKTGDGKDLQLPMLEAMERGDLPDEAVREMTARAKADNRVFTLREFIRFNLKKLLRMRAKMIR